MTAISIAIVGVGKIARDQHVPSLHGNGDFALEATVSTGAGLDGVANFPTLDALLRERPGIEAVALCMPPQVRFDYAATALAAGKHVLLEKPPGATISEVETLVAMARNHRVSLFATWHSRFAAGVGQARDWLKDKRIRHMQVTWKEDVRRWHPGQAWIWEAGGLGVFDPGINALSIVTTILPEPMHIIRSVLEFPEGRDAPIAARLSFSGEDGATGEADFDWRQTGPQTWDIAITTDDGELLLSDGGARLSIGGISIVSEDDGEYAAIYRRLADLIRRREIDVDLAPLVHVADAFMLGRRVVVESFSE